MILRKNDKNDQILFLKCVDIVSNKNLNKVLKASYHAYQYIFHAHTTILHEQKWFPFG